MAICQEEILTGHLCLHAEVTDGEIYLCVAQSI